VAILTCNKVETQKQNNKNYQKMTVFILLLEEINGKFTNITETQKKKAKTCMTGGEGGPGTCPE
jgi:hypothetical protein